MNMHCRCIKSTSSYDRLEGIEYSTTQSINGSPIVDSYEFLLLNGDEVSFAIFMWSSCHHIICPAGYVDNSVKV